ncbi:MAG: TIGR04283 family arsenosugar biosynthesis glycosyltransferase [Bacteroidota bacterium]|nr:TIGR04283 family arsenosugar biosynthesis glycosyltransferase [Bacteroidota bacterium]
MWRISVIIPVFNEAQTIGKTVTFLKKHGGNYIAEILVVDAGSTDDTIKIAQEAGAEVIHSPVKGRAAQMNYAAKQSTGNILYFVHSDTLPPESYSTDIINGVTSGHELGCYRLKLDSRKWLFVINEYFTRFDKMWCRGGDQTLYCTRDLFQEVEGYDEYFVVMEEYDFIIRARKKTNFLIMKKSALASARKYKDNSWLRVMFANYKAFKMFSRKEKPEHILSTYKQMLKW